MPEKIGKEGIKVEREPKKSDKANVSPNMGEKTPEKPKVRSRTSKKQLKTEETHTSKLILFSFEAPQASNVSLVGCFNGWDHQATRLKKNDEGVWTCFVSIEPGEHQYRFIVDGEWQNDPGNANRCWNEFGTENCVLTVAE